MRDRIYSVETSIYDKVWGNAKENKEGEKAGKK
jgi:hypothetical protein